MTTPINWKATLLLLVSSAAAAAEESVQPIEYEVTQVRGYLYGTVDGKTAYQDWRRGTFDKERMIEVQPKKLPDNLPEPVVIPYTEPEVSEVPVGQPKKQPLKGEDKIFAQIGKDEKEARCLILGEGCEELVKPKEEKDSVYFDAIGKAKESRAQQETGTDSRARKVIKP